MTDSDDLLAMRYALGVADLAEMTAAERRVAGDPGFAARVARYDRLMFGLEGASAGMAPPPDLWDRIAGAIDDLEKSPQTETVRASAMAWEPFAPGLDRKILFVDKAAAISGVLYRVAAGTEVANHSHGIIEECLVLEGDIEIDGIIVRAGDLHIAFPGSRHGPLRSRGGALVYIRGDLQMQA